MKSFNILYDAHPGMVEEALSMTGHKTSRCLGAECTERFRNCFVGAMLQCKKVDIRERTALCEIRAEILALWQQVSMDPDHAITSGCTRARPLAWSWTSNRVESFLYSLQRKTR